MPLTPFHGLAFLFLYFKDKTRIDPLALMVSASFIDLEPLYYFLIKESLDHRIWHSFIFALTIYAIVIAIGVYITEQLFEEKLRHLYNLVRLNPNQIKYPWWRIYLCSLFGGFTHIFLDMFTHGNIPYVIYPLANGNPFYLGPASAIVDATAILLTIYSCIIWLKKG